MPVKQIEKVSRQKLILLVEKEHDTLIWDNALSEGAPRIWVVVEKWQDGPEQTSLLLNK